MTMANSRPTRCQIGVHCSTSCQCHGWCAAITSLAVLMIASKIIDVTRRCAAGVSARTKRNRNITPANTGCVFQINLIIGPT